MGLSPVFLPKDKDINVHERVRKTEIYTHTHTHTRARVSTAAAFLRLSSLLLSLLAHHLHTYAGKSQTSRKVVQLLKEMGHRVVAVREPMPYGDLENQVCMPFLCMCVCLSLSLSLSLSLCVCV